MTVSVPPVGGYIFDASALRVIGGAGSERARKLISRLIAEAIREVGPPVRIPAVAMLAAAMTKAHLADHVIQLVLQAPEGAIEVDELSMLTVGLMESVAALDRKASVDVWHAAYEASAHQGWTLVTSQPDTYRPWREQLRVLELR